MTILFIILRLEKSIHFFQFYPPDSSLKFGEIQVIRFSNRKSTCATDPNEYNNNLHSKQNIPKKDQYK